MNTQQTAAVNNVADTALEQVVTTQNQPRILEDLSKTPNKDRADAQKTAQGGSKGRRKGKATKTAKNGSLSTAGVQTAVKKADGRTRFPATQRITLVGNNPHRATAKDYHKYETVRGLKNRTFGAIIAAGVDRAYVRYGIERGFFALPA